MTDVNLLQAAKQEPVARIVRMPGGYHGVVYDSAVLNKVPHGTSLYTHPKEWIGLTDEMIAQIEEAATAIFCDTPSTTPMIISDMIEWYSSTLRVASEKNGGAA